ncbi:MAG: alpha/beta fold hydrolase BchO [Pseudomonadota bacterium]
MPLLDWTRDGKDWPNREASRFLRTGNTDWHVQVMGSGPDLLLVHGTGASSHSWRGLAPLLAQRFRVIAPDLPGHGFSRAASVINLSIQGMAQSLASLLSALDAKPALVVGHSAGGPVLARMILDGLIEPERLVTLNGAFLPFKGIAATVFPPVAKALIWNPLVPQAVAWTAADRKAVKRLIDGTGSTIDRRGIDLYHRLFTCPRHVRSTINMMARWDLEALLLDLPNLETRTDLVSAEHDKTVAPSNQSEIAAILPKSTLTSLPKLGHLAHEEDPGSIDPLI